MITKKISNQSKKSALLNNTAPRGDSKMDKLAQRWIEILLDQLQNFSNCELPGAISVKSFDNKYRA